MKERPILMHARSINGILEGRKTQTRRIIKPAPGLDESKSSALVNEAWQAGFVDAKCPFGVPGDRLWARETWQQYRANSEAQNEAIRKSIERIHSGKSKDIVKEVLEWTHGGGETRVLYAADFGDWAYDVDSDLKPWKPSIHMPRWASRLTLEVTEIRVERVQDISKEDVIAEGVTGLEGVHAGWHQPFAELWDDTNGSGAWERNDWVWGVGFRRLSAALEVKK